MAEATGGNNVIDAILDLFHLRGKDKNADDLGSSKDSVFTPEKRSQLKQERAKITEELRLLYWKQHEDPNQIRNALEAMKQKRIQAPDEATKLALDARGSAAANAKVTKEETQKAADQRKTAVQIPAVLEGQAKKLNAAEMVREEERKRREKQRKMDKRREEEQAEAERHSRLRHATDVENEGHSLKAKKLYHQAISFFDKALRIRIHGLKSFHAYSGQCAPLFACVHCRVHMHERMHMR
jgi:hypothetical protein